MQPTSKYAEFLRDPEDVFLIEALEQVDAMIANALKPLDKKLINAKGKPKPEVTLYRSLVSMRLELLTQAGLTPKARKQIGAKPVKTESPEAELNEFLASGTNGTS